MYTWFANTQNRRFFVKCITNSKISDSYGEIIPNITLFSIPFASVKQRCKRKNTNNNKTVFGFSENEYFWHVELNRSIVQILG